MFAAELKTIIPHEVTPVSIDLNMEIPTGYFGTINPWSGLFAGHFVTCDVGIIDFDYRGVILVLMINLSDEPYLVEKGEIIAQFALNKKETISLKQVNC